MKNKKGITLISLVITIVVLIILASVAINMTLGENGIFNKAKVANKAQVIAEVKEKIGTDILAAQIEATERNESLEKEQIEDIISNYGELQEDGDTIILNDNGYEVSLLDIYSGTTVTSGSYSENKAKISKLEQSISDGKLSIASAITAKGVTTSADDTFETMAENIGNITAGADTLKEVCSLSSAGSYTVTEDGVYLVFCAGVICDTRSGDYITRFTVSKNGENVTSNTIYIYDETSGAKARAYPSVSLFSASVGDVINITATYLYTGGIRIYQVV